MPTYQYKCQRCATTLDYTNPINAPTNAPTCLLCGQITTRIYTTPAISFKGTGWASKPR